MSIVGNCYRFPHGPPLRFHFSCLENVTIPSSAIPLFHFRSSNKKAPQHTKRILRTLHFGLRFGGRPGFWGPAQGSRRSARQFFKLGLSSLFHYNDTGTGSEYLGLAWTQCCRAPHPELFSSWLSEALRVSGIMDGRDLIVGARWLLDEESNLQPKITRSPARFRKSATGKCNLQALNPQTLN